MSDLTIEYIPNCRPGSATVTARLFGEPIACETFNLTKSKERASFADTVCDSRPGIERSAVESRLLGIADVLTKEKTDAGPATLSADSEIDASHVVRPERFITPEVSGVAVPIATDAGGRVEARWFAYLRWADGQRERRPLREAIEIPGGDRLWVWPIPADPTPTTRPEWSRESRRAWLDGAPAPDPADVFKRLCERIAFFLDFPPDQATGITATLALWSMFTYVYHAWDAAPYLYIGGPTNSGKTRVLHVLQRLAFRPFFSSNVSAPSLFRTLHSEGGVFLYDESERLKQTNAPDVGELLSALLAGYKRGGRATRLEPVGDGFRTVHFDVFGPKALACIAGLPPALASRCIVVTMFRAAADSDKPGRRIDAAPELWRSLRDDLHALALEHGADFLELADRADVCPAMGGREQELWQPLLALAAWVESHGADGLLSLMRSHALAVIDEGRGDQTPDADAVLLRIVADAIRAGDKPQAKDILAAAKEAEPELFKPWSARGVSSHLARYGIKTNKSGKPVYGRVTVEHLRRIQDTYGIDLGFVGTPGG